MQITIPPQFKPYVWPVAVGLLAIMTAIAYGSEQAYKRAKAELAATTFGIQAETQREYIADLESRVRTGDRKLEAQEAIYRGQLAELKRHPAPPPVGKPPETSPELQNGLLDLGMKPGLVVLADPFKTSQIALSDAQLAWTWGKEAKRIAPLEDRVSGLESALKACDDLNTQNAEALKLRDTVIEAVKKESTLNKGQAEELGKAVVAEKKRSTVQKWLWGAAGLGVGWLARGK